MSVVRKEYIPTPEEKQIAINDELQDAIGQGYDAYALKLLKSGAQVNVKPEKGIHLPLVYACALGNLQTVKMLIENGADVNANNFVTEQDANIIRANFSNALIVAIDFQFNNIVKTLIKNGADVNIKDVYGKSAAIYAVDAGIDNGYHEILKLLVEHGADINAVLEDGNSPLLQAIHKGDERIVKYLLKNGATLANSTEFDFDILPALKDGDSYC